jgi:prolyl oligopeptidase
MHPHSGLVLGLALSLAAFAVGADTKVNYPLTRRVDLVEDYHGTTVADPYRWLEDDVRTSAEVAGWVAEQNKVTDAFLSTIKERDAIKARLTELWNYERYSVPSKHGHRYFFTKNDGLQNQSVVYTAEPLDSEPLMLLDPNTWSKDGTVAMAGLAVTEDGNKAAYAVAEAGSDWNTWKVIDVTSGKKQDDEVKWVKFSNAAWDHAGSGFFYGRFPAPEPGATFQSLNLNQKLYYHKLGTPQSEDPLVYTPTEAKWGVGAQVTDDGKYLVVSVSDGTTSRRSRILYKDLSDPHAEIKPLIDDFESRNFFIDNIGPTFYLRTDRGAERSRVVAINVSHPKQADWKEIIPQAADNLTFVELVGDRLICQYLKDARSLIKVYSNAGQFVRDVDLPGIGTASGFGGKREDKDTFYSFSSFATPPSIYRYDIATGKSTLFRQAKVKFTPSDYEVTQVFVPSKDGTKVPMFLTYKKGLKHDGTNPTLLYGYGGFNIPLTPQFSIQRVAWLEMGGVYAQACLRGGGEYGENWHRAGTKDQKQNVFDDCIACAEWLIKEKITQPAKLAVQGGSNGGLLVGAVMTQRPDLFGACLPAVGVMDMLRFQKFTAGRFWVDDYGSSDNAADFKALFAYSPYHNLRPGTKYPATLVTTADTDDRVVPGHSFKFIAQLQQCQAGAAPVVARIETRAGHGAGKPTSKLIEEVADQLAFLVKTLNMKTAN